MVPRAVPPFLSDFAAPVSAPARKQPSAGFLPDSEVIQRVEIAESPVKRAFRGV